jgi:hypothetical protein
MIRGRQNHLRALNVKNSRPFVYLTLGRRMILEAIEQMQQELASMEAYMIAKIKSKDYHAVSDAANDCREIYAKIEVLLKYGHNTTSQEDKLSELRKEIENRSVTRCCPGCGVASLLGNFCMDCKSTMALKIK